jgi:uncharacterized protein YpbB
MRPSNPKLPQLTEIQQIILDCVRANPGQFSRSGLAKLLTGSTSKRTEHVRDHCYFGRLSQFGRKQLTHDIEVLLQQGFLKLDRFEHVIPAD